MNVDINIYNMTVKETRIHFEYSIKNNGEKTIWFHRDANASRFQKQDAYIYIYIIPVDTLDWVRVGSIFVETIEIEPKATILTHYNQPAHYFQEYSSDVEFIDLKLAFTYRIIDRNPLGEGTYQRFLKEEGVFIHKEADVSMSHIP